SNAIRPRSRASKAGLCGWTKSRAHDPEKWEPVFGKDPAQGKLLNQAEVAQRCDVALGRWRREAAEHEALDAAGCGNFRDRRADGDTCRAIGGKAVDARRDRGEGNRRQPMLPRERKAGAVTRGQQVVLVGFSAMP